ncbi:MAG: tyrosine--tRNA ligase [Nitrososphaeria archaeon]
MDLEERLELIKRLPTEEVITEQDLRDLLETNEHPVAYDGFEPSGLAHVPFGVLRAAKLRDMLDAGCRFKLLLADWHAMINNKMGGDLEKIRKVGEYLIEVWRASGIDPAQVDIVWSNDMVADREYWKLFVSVAKNVTVQRLLRCLTIMGRREAEIQQAAQLYYPAMQVSDIFFLKVDICQLGLDQRRANILARETGPKLGLWKPVAVHHHMLMGLRGLSAKPMGFDENRAIDLQIASKMSKSKPETTILVHDSAEEIARKIRGAYCPSKDVKNNPVLEYCKYIIFLRKEKLTVERPKKYGGNLEYFTYDNVETDYRAGKIHPLDLKNATSRALNEILKPIREHFQKNSRARDLHLFVRAQETTR